ncbi:XkdF-like putative serine protease domain-containing protein [Hymenobacter sp. YC55]|nr:XkdF-like putative serine protease domain-containing protein [Hymenobacter sp. YC55]
MSTKSKTPKRYAVKLDQADPAKGYQLVSLVAKPAIEQGWVALAAAEDTTAKRVHLSTEPAKQVLTGPVLIPDQNIYRNDPEPHYIFFSAEEIEKIAHKLMLEGRTTQTNEDHTTELSGNVVRELWIVLDSEKDKAAALGLDMPVGTLMMSLHVPDTDYWEKEVVSGNKTGFSIEGLFDFSEVKLSAEASPAPSKKMDFKSIWARLSIVAKGANVKLAEVELADGRLVDVAEDGTVKLLNDEGEAGDALPDGDYDLKEGGKLSVEGGKKKAESAPAPKEEEKLDEEKPEDKPDTLAAAKEALAGVAEETDAAKLTAQIKKALAALGVTELSAAVKLEAVAMADGSTFNLNPITRLVTDSTGQVVGTGAYACADGSYFKINLDQYCYQIDKDTYERSLKLEAVEKELADAKLELSTQPATGKLKLGGEEESKPMTPAQLRLARAEATR